jgi:methylated-DNA-protein-cysteine methyltransferase-like protein
MDYQIIYKIVRRIPAGRVATYGQLATLAGWGRRARHVGYAMHSAPDGVPWHRVINSRGEISKRSSSDHDELQRMMLEAEGVEFNLRGRVDLEKYRWEPRGNGARVSSPASLSGARKQSKKSRG